MTELFEDNQRDLERAVENLGYSLEQNIGDTGSIAKLRQDITNQSVSGSVGLNYEGSYTYEADPGVDAISYRSYHSYRPLTPARPTSRSVTTSSWTTR